LDNITFRIIVLAMTLTFSFLCAVVVGLIVGYDLLIGFFTGEFEVWSAQFLAIALVFPVLYVAVGFWNPVPIIITVLASGVATGGFLVAATDIGVQFGRISPFALYVSLYAILALLLRWIWMNPKVIVLKGIRFSLMGSSAYLFLLMAVHFLSGEPLPFDAIVQYFYFSLTIFISETVSVTVAERVFGPLARRWRVPDFMEDESANDED
jgi:hypothetical protein